MNRTKLLHQTRVAVRVVLFSTIGAGIAAGTGFAGVHLYLETHDPTPTSWPQKARFSYRAAVFNSEYLQQYEAAKTILETTLASLQHDQDLQETPTPVVGKVIDQSRRLRKADPDEGIAKALILLGNIERKQGRLEAAMQNYIKALPQALFNMRLQSSAARRLGEIQEVFGMTREAESSFDLAVQSVLPQHKSGYPLRIDGTMKYTPEMIESVKALALFRARQGKYKDTLNTLMSVLQFQQSHPATQSQLCETASTMSNLAEIVFALGDERECRRWTAESLDLCQNTKKKDDKYCLECAGINYNLLGVLSLRKSEMQEARSLFNKALVLAERAGDEAGSRDYAQNLEKCL